MTRRVTFLVAFDIHDRADVAVIRKALLETLEEAFRDARHPGLVTPAPNVSVVHHPTLATPNKGWSAGSA